MRIALLADVHANREAFEACLAHAEARGADRFLFLGDYVNYGADPEWTVAEIRRRVEGGAVALLGNHDASAGGAKPSMTPSAEFSLDWTRNRLDADDRRFLGSLPLVLDENGIFFSHADGSAPRKWLYVRDKRDAYRSLDGVGRKLVVCGHVHRPAIYSVSPTEKTTAFTPLDGVPVPLLPRRRCLVVVGSVGQPRDGNPAAAYALLDLGRAEITMWRVPYDVERAAEKIRAAGLPEVLAERLRAGW